MRAMEPSYVASLRRQDLEDLILRKPEVSLRLVKELAERLRRSEMRVALLTRMSVPQRLANLILSLEESEGVVSGEGYRIPTRYTHEQLATMIGCRRVAVSRSFKKLKETGAVELDKRHIVVKDLDALKGFAERG